MYEDINFQIIYDVVVLLYIVIIIIIMIIIMLPLIPYDFARSSYISDKTKRITIAIKA